jgi:hypothetical protein
MKKNYYRPLVCLVLFPVAGCHLIDMDDILHHPDKIPQLCDITKMTYLRPGYSGGQVVNTVFYYNKWGNPDSIISDYSSTGHPSRHYFKYDHQRRLASYLSAFDSENGSYWAWRVYQYDHKNRIISDSNYSFGILVNNQPQYPPESQFRIKSTYTYDAKDRVLKVVYRSGSGSIVTRSFVYDSRGNRQDDDGTPPEVYDNKVSIYRTHRIWMFIMLNYSINNAPSGDYPPTLPVAYNQYGLPLDLREFTPFVDFGLGKNAVITYKCK